MHGVCVRCSVVTNRLGHTQEAQTLVETMFTSDDKSDLCCAKTPGVALALIKELTEGISSTTPLPDLPIFHPKNFTFSHASAHKRLIPSKPWKSNHQGPPKLPEFPENGCESLLMDPYTTDEMVEHVRNVTVNPWGYQIIVEGWYYVYSSVLFKPATDRPCRDFKKQVWHHDIVVGRFQDLENSGVFERGVHTCCDDCTNTEETSIIGRLVYLKVNDYVQVQVSGDGLVSFKRESTFF